MIPVTLLYAGLLALLSVLLANQVLYVRLRAQTMPAWKPDATLRVQANFVENVPLALVLLYLVEVSGVAAMVVHVFGCALVLFRVLDIAKPLGIRRLEAFAGGKGVVADDVGAGACAMIGVAAVRWLGF